MRRWCVRYIVPDTSSRRAQAGTRPSLATRDCAAFSSRADRLIHPPGLANVVYNRLVRPAPDGGGNTFPAHHRPTP